MDRAQEHVLSETIWELSATAVVELTGDGETVIPDSGATALPANLGSVRGFDGSLHADESDTIPRGTS